MTKPRHTRHHGASGNRPHRSRSKIRASRFGESTDPRKKRKGPKRRYAHGGGHGPQKKRKKRRKSSKKRRVLRYTIRYDQRGQVRRRRRNRSRSMSHSRATRVPRAVLAVGLPSAAPEVTAITAAMTARAHRPIVPRAPIAPRTLVPKISQAARTIAPKPPVDFAARTAGRTVLKTAN